MNEPPPEPEPPAPRFPAWLAPVVATSVSLILVGAYFVLFPWGLVLAFTGKGHHDWPSSNEQVQSWLSTIGGLSATFFTIALNLPTHDKPNIRAARVLGLLRGTGINWKRFDRKILVIVGTALVILYAPMAIAAFVVSLARPEQTPDFISKFGGPGVGMLVTATLLWASRLTRPGTLESARGRRGGTRTDTSKARGQPSSPFGPHSQGSS
jgi:hypothetical protein